MKIIPSSVKRAAMFALASAAVAAFVVSVDPLPNVSGGAVSTTTAVHGTSATAASTTSSVTPAGGLIAAGPSRNECLEPNFDDTGLAALQAAISSFESTTNSFVSCVSAYLDGAVTWSQWVHPWVTDPRYGYSSWVAESPQSRQLILAVQLIPNDLQDLKDPLKWENACAAGKFDSYATQLGKNLVAGGLQNSVLRLGPEMNGIWETDYMGTTVHEQRLWAKCFDNEAAALRRAPGENFLMDWNPNACKGDFPYKDFYPGNAYVDVVGLDIFDVSCVTPRTPLSFPQLANEPAGLTDFEAFAAAMNKPMSLPEWGLMPIPSGDDPGYINGIGTAVANKDFAFECYFDANLVIRAYLPLGPRTPLALAAFQKWFGSSS